MISPSRPDEGTTGSRQDQRSSRSKFAGIHAMATTCADCIRSAMTCTSISSLGAASPFSAAISGAISSTREPSCSKVDASVLNGSSSFEHHHTPASLSHSARISKILSLLQARRPAPFHVVSLALRDGSECGQTKTTKGNTRLGARLVIEPGTKEAHAQTFN